jgi:hypothetical protein
MHKLLLASLFGSWQTWWIATQRHECRGMMLGQWLWGLQPEMWRAILYSVGMLSRFVSVASARRLFVSEQDTKNMSAHREHKWQ